MEIKRLTAAKTKISDVTTGKYVALPGFESNYVLAKDGQRLSRVRILATIVDKFLSESGRFAAITLDDSTDTIRAKAFNAVAVFDPLSAGDIVDFVGKVREYQGELYLVPEIIRKIDDPNYELLRELEIKRAASEWSRKRDTVLSYQKHVSDIAELKKMLKERFGIAPKDVEAILQTEQEEPQTPELIEAKDSVLRLIVELDNGNGCDYSELIAKSGIEEAALDTIINELLEEGVCFEPRPGKIKKL
jgi:RPA family protein